MMTTKQLLTARVDALRDAVRRVEALIMKHQDVLRIYVGKASTDLTRLEPALGTAGQVSLVWDERDPNVVQALESIVAEIQHIVEASTENLSGDISKLNRILAGVAD